MLFPKDQNDYALNIADPDAIVYRDRMNQLHRLTAPQFESPEEFARWKRISDESYHGIFKKDRNYYDHKVSLGKQDPESASTAEMERAMRQRRSILRRYRAVEKKLQKILTRTQLRRYKMRHEGQMTLEEIAEAEKVCHPTVLETLTEAELRIEKKFRRKL